MSSTMKRVSAAVAALFASIILMMGVSQLAWAEDSSLVAGGVDGDLAAQEGLDGQEESVFEAQATSSDFESPDGLVGVYGITAGKVSYNRNTKTLTLNGVKASRVEFLKSGSLVVNLVGNNALDIDRYYSSTKSSVTVKGSGTLAGHISCSGNLTVSGGTVSGEVYCDGNMYVNDGVVTAKNNQRGWGVCCLGDLKVSGGTLNMAGGESYDDGGLNGCLYCCGNLTISGGTVTAVGGYKTISCKGNVYLSGGTLSAGVQCDGSLIATKGALKGDIISCGGKLTAGGAIITATNVGCGNMVVKAGAVNVSAKSGGITCRDSFAMSGGTVTVKNPDYGIRVGDYETSLHNFTMTGGKVQITNPSYSGIDVKAGNFAMKGGTVSVTGCYGNYPYSAIDANSYTYRGKTYGGKVTVSGGALTATTRVSKSGSYGSAISADSMTNKPSCLKSIVGSLPTGACFTVNKITYVAKNSWSAFVSMPSGNFKSLPEKVKYGKVTYYIDGFSPCASRMPVGATSMWITKDYQSAVERYQKVLSENWYSASEKKTELKYAKDEMKRAASDYKLKVLSGADVVSVKGLTVTAKKPGTAKVAFLDSSGRQLYTRSITVYALSGKYLMQSCMKGKSGMCLDMNGASKANGAQMIVWGKNGGKNQQFTFLKQKDGSYVVKSVNSGKVLDVNGASKSWGQNVIQWKANGGDNQKWRISVDANNRATFTNVNSGLVFDVSGGKADWGAPMIQWGGNGGLNQKWSLVAVK